MTYEQAYDLIRTRPARIGYYMGFDDLTDIHNEWLLKMIWSKGDLTMQAHRGSYKTSCDSLFLALSPIIRPTENILFLRKTDDDVAEVIAQAQTMIRSEAMKEIAKALTGEELYLVKDTKNEIQTSLYSGISGVSQVLGLGIGASLTGKHADKIVTDDIVNIKDRISRAERERTKVMYQELRNVLNRGGRFINTGTPWHKDDAFTMMSEPIKYDCYTTGLMTDEEIRHLQSTMSASLFAANYQLRHIADENAMFKDARFESDREKIYDGICHIDAAYGGEDSTAFTVIAEKDGNLIVYGRKFPKHVDDCLDEIMSLKAKYRAGTTWCEDNGDKGYLKKELKARGDVAEKYHEKMNKHIKISTYLKENWGRVLFLDDTDPEYIAEILDYNEHAAHDDCPDSLASAIRQLGHKPMTLNRKVRHGL
jgi:phage terminase large subunit-like protein